VDKRRKIIAAFIAIYILVVHGHWLCPALPWRGRIFNPIQYIADSIGLGGANLAVFAPEVGHVNIRLYVLVRDDNGRTITWIYPCIEQWSLVQRMFNDRFRKYSEVFRLSNQIHRRQIGMWIDLACFAARSCNFGSFHPSSVFVVRHTQAIKLPGRIQSSLPSEDEILFSYSLGPGDL
jgi:hypothetical protein